MTLYTELWLTYHQTSRIHKPATAQLIELEHAGQRLVDLDDVLEHVFERGFVDVKHRTVCWWEQFDGAKVAAGRDVQDLLCAGVGDCPEHALRLVIADMPPALWVRYIYKHTPRAHAATQRVKLTAHHERLAHITNFVFAQGYLPSNVRPCVYWEGVDGGRLAESMNVREVLAAGEGISEEKSLRLVIGMLFSVFALTNRADALL
ncbi:hypothetical protein OF83DRAFT_1171823 [Amylostereum chailletii]|nr:hypothetical protein OF83DRAFT_1171823 [Amylostereum chailletii]